MALSIARRTWGVFDADIFLQVMTAPAVENAGNLLRDAGEKVLGSTRIGPRLHEEKQVQ